MNKIILDKEEVIKIESAKEFVWTEGEKKEIYIWGENDKYKLRYHLEKGSSLIVHHYSINASFDIEIELAGDNARIDYFYSTINYQNQVLKFSIFHTGSKTYSNIINHGVNVKDRKLLFDVNPKVKKNAVGCVCNQENSIINLEDGESMICPNLLIDNYDVISSHSAYIGSFSKEMLFYMMSRGLTEKASYELLMRYFLLQEENIAVERIPRFLEEIKKL